MKIATISTTKAKLSEVIERARTERVVITNHGRPVAILVGVEDVDLETVLTTEDAELWALIEERRERSPRGDVSLAEVRARCDGTGRRKSGS